MTGVAETFTAAARAASQGAWGAGVNRALVSMAGTKALLCYRFDEAEHTRRQRAGMQAVASSDVLELLLGLPLAIPVPVSSLTSRERAALALAPRAAVSIECGHVIRHATAPVMVELALVPAGTWRAGLETAGRFTPFCARAMVLHRQPRDVDEMRLQAGFYGVGVIVAADQAAEVLVEPEPFHRVRFTAAAWRFLEEAYRKVR